MTEAAAAAPEGISPGPVIGCGCGRDHPAMPYDIETNDDGSTWAYELVCREHLRHMPCRPCMRRDGFYDETGRVKASIRAMFAGDQTAADPR